MAKGTATLVAACCATLLAVPAPASPPDPQVLIYATEGNRLRRLDADTIDTGLIEDVLQPSAADDPNGRDSNGSICRFRDGTGRYIHGEDTDQPHPPAGFGVFAPDGTQIGKLTPTYPAYTSGQPEPHGCAVLNNGNVFTTDVGQQGFGFDNGQLTLWFPPFDRFPGPPPPDPNAYPNNDEVSTNFCKIDEHIGTAASVVADRFGRVYVASSSGLVVYRYQGNWPTGLGPGEGCEATDSAGGPMVDPGRITRTVFLPPNGVSTYSGLALAPGGRIYVATVLEGKIREYDVNGNFRRFIVNHGLPIFTLPTPFGSPQGLALGPDGTLYYADLDLRGTLPNVGPGPNGKVWRVRFDAAGNPLPPEIVRENLAFPDGVAVLPGDLEPPRQRTMAGGPKRQAHYGQESIITPANAGDLAERWSYTVGGAITGSPIVAEVEVPGEGKIRVVYSLSWDRNVYAVRLRDGTLLWKVPTDEQPNATFPTAGSVDVTDIDGRDVVYVGSGEVFYALDAGDGSEIWRFTAGTGCGTLGVGGPFPGYCARSGEDERNEIEGSPFVASGMVFVTMDVNDKEVGKGGLYGLDARNGRMRWFFDLESGMTCRPLLNDVIRQYDPYHDEAELNLPAGFLATRPGCDHPRSRNGCGDVWSSPAVDFEREALYIASSNCDTDFDAGSNKPLPPMPPYDEALFSLTFDGTPAWVWRPREVDNADLAFGGAPNLFEIEFGGATRQVVGVGNKDGRYRVLDRDGVNEITGVIEPYWSRGVVGGGDIGGIIATASVDEDARRIYFSTAAGKSPTHDPPLPAQQPTLHILDMDTGEKLWQNTYANGFLPPQRPSFGPTSSIPGVVFFGSVPGAFLRVHDALTGDLLKEVNLANFALTSMATVSHGTVLVGEGIGPGFTATQPAELNALCVPGTAGCSECNNGVDDDGDGKVDHGADTGCTGPADVSELPECADEWDNDHDGNGDFGLDPGCRDASEASREAPECDDGVDNDGDGDVDGDDAGCPEAWWVSEAEPPILALELSPADATNPPGTDHTVVLGVEDQLGLPYPGIAAIFTVTSGPNAGTAGTCSPNADCTTDAAGSVSFTYTGDGGSGPDEIVASVLDAAGQPVLSNAAHKLWNTPPDCSAASADPDELWPANHLFAEVAVVGVTDPDGDPVTLLIDAVHQDEPVTGGGSGDTEPDATGVGAETARLRAERAGSGDGRVYHVDFTAEDVWGAACSGAVAVCVPHDRGHGGRACGDQGERHDSTLVLGCGLGFELVFLLPPLALLRRRRRDADGRAR